MSIPITDDDDIEEKEQFGIYLEETGLAETEALGELRCATVVIMSEDVAVPG